MKTKTQNPQDIFRQLMGSDETNLIIRTLNRAEIADEEIAGYKEAHPDHAQILHGAFPSLIPTPPLSNAGDDLYRRHCRQLLDRVLRGLDLQPGTDAEILAFLSQASQRAPLDRTATLLYWRLFSKVFPREAAAITVQAGSPPHEEYDQQRADELLTRLRKQLRHSRTP